MAARLGPWRLEHVVDGRKLRVQLTAAALEAFNDPAAARPRVLALLKDALFRGRSVARERLEAGASGLDCARLLSAVMDEVISALFDYVTVHMFRARNPTVAERFAVVATGGYGRASLAPSSDVDLLFLRAYKDAPWAESVTEAILYMLWDLGLKVGHASRTLDDCMRAARDDITIRTSLLEMRLVCGDEGLLKDLEGRLRRDLFAGTAAAFAAAKLKERDERHARTGASRYAVEPNIKDGKGGLRDLHTLFWIARYIHGFDNLTDYSKAGVFTRAELATFLRAVNFLWTVRFHLHTLTGRAEERLTFDLQPEIARRMGYMDRRSQAGVERFMKRYFLVAREVGALTRILCAKLEADEQKAHPSGLSRFLPRARPRRDDDDPDFMVDGGRLSFADPDAPGARPILTLRLFARADRRNLDIHPDALAAVTRNLQALRPSLRRDPEARTILLEIIASPRNPAAVLRLMNEAGVLGRLVPEFGRIVAKTQFNMYHRYTVDEHTLLGLQIIADIEHGRCEAEHPLATSVFPLIANRRALYLAMLLHDVGKAGGDQQIAGAIAARAACERLGVGEEETELVAWLVGHHLVMSDVAQRRDLSDPRAIASFTELVASPERLRLLSVLTVADIRAVGPGVWNGWKAQLLRDLFRLTEAALRGGRADEQAIRERLAEQAADARARLSAEPALADWFSTVDDAYWIGLDASQQDWHAGVVRASLAAGVAVWVDARVESRRGATELLVLAPDRPGLFAAIAGAIADAGANVVDARIHTTRAGQAFDVFALHDINGDPFGAGNPRALAALTDRVRAAAGVTVPSPPPPEPAPPKRLAAFAIDPWVTVDNEASETETVVEVSGRDRPGLLRDLAQALAEEGLVITSAHVDGFAERVADAFYVREAHGGKREDPRAIARLKASLSAVLSRDEPEGPLAPARLRLPRARASSAR
jgi:[protein-PII] uridylyltransferase